MFSGKCELFEHHVGVPDVCQQEEPAAQILAGPPRREGKHGRRHRLWLHTAELQVREASGFRD